eukprot:892525-Prorocentrum_minimum.AAC.1
MFSLVMERAYSRFLIRDVLIGDGAGIFSFEMFSLVSRRTWTWRAPLARSCARASPAPSRTTRRGRRTIWRRSSPAWMSPTPCWCSSTPPSARRRPRS